MAVPKYQNLPEKDYDFIQLMIKLKTRRQREKSGLILLEGRRLIFDALMSGVVAVKSIFFADPENIRQLPSVPHECKLFRVTEGRLSAWSDLTTSPELIAVAQEPDYKTLLESQLANSETAKLPLTVICDNVREPGNMGSILRVIAAAGCDKALATKGCVDVWERKTLRGAMGAHFRVPVLSNISWQTASELIPENSQVYLADSNSFEVTSAAEGQKPEPEDFAAETEDDSGADNSEKMKLPVVAYTDVRFTDSSHVTLIVGGETEGLSGAAHKLAHQKGGVKVHIPMGNRMESLNAATAAGILIFEIRRQFKEKLAQSDSKTD